MSIADKLRGFSSSMQDKAKNGTRSITLTILRLLTGLILGITFGLIVSAILQSGTFSLIFVTLVTLLVFMKISTNWQFGHVLIFDLICILLGLLLRMYVLIAP